MTGHISLTGKHLLRAEDLLFHTTSVLAKMSNNYWLEGGSLLGIIRENRLLPWDNDVDLSFMYNDIGNFEKLLSGLKVGGYRVRVRSIDVDSKHLNMGMPRVIKIRKNYLFGLFKSKVCLDIFVKYEANDRAYWVVNQLVKSVPMHYYQAFKTVTFKQHDLSIPENTNGYLEARYGDWKNPVKEWNTFTDDKALEAKN